MIGEDVPTTPANDVTEADAIIEKKAGARKWQIAVKTLVTIKKECFSLRFISDDKSRLRNVCGKNTRESEYNVCARKGSPPTPSRNINVARFCERMILVFAIVFVLRRRELR